MRGGIVQFVLGVFALFAASNAAASEQTGPLSLMTTSQGLGENYQIGQKVFQQTCAGCHNASGGRAPQPSVLRAMRPDVIYKALTQGVMKPVASSLSDAERIAVSEYLAERKMVSAKDVAPPFMCPAKHARFDRMAPPTYAGWGFDLANSHAVSAKAAGLTRADLGKLKLKWAYGFADSNRARSQPSLAAGAIFMGSHNGHILALDRETGCERWRYEAKAEVRTAVVIEPWQRGDSKADPLAFFGDLAGNVYAVRAFTGEPVWTVRGDTHNVAIITGTPALYDGTLFVPISSMEENSAADPNYPCCTFRGSVVALDARTGKEKWRTWLVGEPQQRKDESGKTEHGPSGVAVWNTPAVDPRRGLIYFATGDNYTQPATELSDAVIALDMKTGAIRWSHQAIEGDAWNVGCFISSDNCPDDAGPDFDFGAGVILTRTRGGRDVVLAGQKAGITYAFDADSGEQVWKRRVGRGGLAGGVLFGIASQNGRLYAPVSDFGEIADKTHPAMPGLNAVDVTSGDLLWSAPMANVCRPDQVACLPGISSPPTATPGFVLAGADDGHLRAYAPDSGEVLLDLDLTTPFATVNGVEAKGGAMSGGAAPIVDGGQIIVASGYGHAMKMAGNVLLVYEKQ
ncbi:MAG: PQQ-binding-like beta-propeller repeat protein [Novosphingobium sp.]|nr:PQQ-binding-like beta-propeller repeat protein [Novosphingobium sp.]